MNVNALQPLRSPLAKALLVATLIVGSVVVAALAVIYAALPVPASADARPPDDEAPARWNGAGATMVDAAIGGFE